MTRGPDPYATKCGWTEEGSQFGESFECTDPANHKGSHYDSYLNTYRPNRT
jgi:hypothetical protein